MCVAMGAPSSDDSPARFVREDRRFVQLTARSPLALRWRGHVTRANLLQTIPFAWAPSDNGSLKGDGDRSSLQRGRRWRSAVRVRHNSGMGARSLYGRGV
jgi:hypothetical protein